MSYLALRQLRLGSIKRIYKLDVPELCTALQDCANRRLQDKKVLDALFYRAALLRPYLSPSDLAVTTDSLARVRRDDPAFLDYVMQEVRAKSRRFKVRDTARLLNALAKLAFRDELLTASLLPPLMRRITEKTRWEDLALLALSMARLGDSAREPVFDRIVAVLLPRIHKLDDGHSLSLLACAFTRPPALPGVANTVVGPLFAAPEAAEGLLLDDMDSGNGPAQEECASVEIPHLAFIEVLLVQCERHAWCFRSAGLLHLCLALSTLASSGHKHLFPSRLLKRLEKRLDSLYYDFNPAQLVRMLELLVHLPELESQCAAKLLNEVAYRIRDVTPKSCVSVLRIVARLGGHPRAGSAASWRLSREDAGATLSVVECCDAAEIFAAMRPRLWESREALLCLLQGLSTRRVEPEPALLARLLRAYGELGVRDTHWFHLCAKLSLYDLSNPVPQALPRRGDGELQPIDQVVAADCLLALARLNLPQLVDAAALVSRLATCVPALEPGPAATALEGAAIFSLIGRRPQELARRGALNPLVAAIQDGGEDDFPLQLRLFPFSDLAGACGRELRAAWQVAAEVHAAPQGVSDFEIAITREISTWSGVEFVRSIAVGPIYVPLALSLVDLAEYLRANPLGPAASLGAIDEDDDEEVEEEGAGRAVGGESDDEANSPQLRRRTRRRSPRRGRSAPDAAIAKGVSLAGIWAEPATAGEARPDSHVLMVPLMDADFYHASVTLRGERQRAKGQLLGAEKFAELCLLRQLGWRVCGLPEHLWTWGAEGDKDTSMANRDLIFRLIANLSDDR